MSEIRVKQHPTLGILACTDGHVMVPARYQTKPHWTLGTHIGKYLKVGINYKPYLVHRLIAETFLPNPNNLPTVDHIDRNPSNNVLSNLRWASYSDQNRNKECHELLDAQGRTHYYEDPKEANRQHAHKYYHEHKDKCSAALKIYRSKNKEKIQKRYKEYYTKNREKFIEHSANYYKNNKEQFLIKQKEHRARKRLTHKAVILADGTKRWIPIPQAIELLKLPVKERVLLKT